MIDLRELYFQWRYDMIVEGTANHSYVKLMRFLDTIEFTWLPAFPRDENRYVDGVDLRYRFGYEMGFDYNQIEDEFEDVPCSVFEMMLALALRCEEDIMSSEEAGNRTYEWFWEMIDNLELGYMDDDEFNEKVAYDVVRNFLDRNYSPEGDGNIIYIERCEKDLRTIEIWFQMMLYLSNKTKGETL